MEGDDDPNNGERDPHDRAVEAAPAKIFGEPRDPEKETADKQNHAQPTDFDRSLQQTDKTIKRFTVVSGLSAAVSAGAAIYAASQLSGSSAQMNQAIDTIANMTTAAQDQSNMLTNEVAEVKRQADYTQQLVAPAQSQAQSAAKQTDIAGKNMIATNRAWLVTRNVAILLVGSGAQPVLNFANEGKSPAQDARIGALTGFPEPIRDTQGLIDRMAQRIPANTTCGLKKTTDLGVILPNNPNGRNASGPAFNAPEGLESGKRLVTFQGCLTYRTLGEVHHTWFCYFALGEPLETLGRQGWIICAGSKETGAD